MAATKIDKQMHVFKCFAFRPLLTICPRAKRTVAMHSLLITVTIVEEPIAFVPAKRLRVRLKYRPPQPRLELDHQWA